MEVGHTKMVTMVTEPSFHINQQELFMISLGVNACVLTQLTADCVIGWMAPLMAKRMSLVRTLFDLHRKRPGLLARIIMEQLTLWALVLITLVSLTYTSLSSKPFSHQPAPYPDLLIRIVLTSSAARFLVIGARIVLVKDLAADQQEINSQLSYGQTGKLVLDFLYALVWATNCLVCLAYNENLLLGVTVIFTEVSTTPLECCRLIKLSQRHLGSKSYRKTVILSLGVCILCRAVLSILLLYFAVRNESPLEMDTFPIVWLFVSWAFKFFHDAFLIYQSIGRFERSRDYLSACPIQVDSSTTPFSTQKYTTVFSNNISPKKDNGDASFCQLKDLNYGLVRPYNNKNLTCSLGNDAVDKLNVLKKKEMPKYSLLQKFTPSDVSFSSGGQVKRPGCLTRSGSGYLLLEHPSSFDEDAESVLIDMLTWGHNSKDSNHTEGSVDTAKLPESSSNEGEITTSRTTASILNTNAKKFGEGEDNIPAAEQNGDTSYRL